jgi:hypothetical protein
MPGLNFMFAENMKSACCHVSMIIPKKFDSFWKSIKSFADIGGGSGFMTFEICKA